jgi:hypothetical protein
MHNNFYASLDWDFSIFGVTFQVYFDSEPFPKGTFSKGRGIHGIHLKWFYFGFCTNKVFKRKLEDLVADAMLAVTSYKATQTQRTPSEASPSISLNKDNLH